MGKLVAKKGKDYTLDCSGRVVEVGDVVAYTARYSKELCVGDVAKVTPTGATLKQGIFRKSSMLSLINKGLQDEG